MYELRWRHGEKAKLAKAAGISPSYLGDILHGRTGATPKLAIKLREEAQKLGKIIHEMDWIYPNRSVNPLISSHIKSNGNS